MENEEKDLLPKNNLSGNDLLAILRGETMPEQEAESDAAEEVAEAKAAEEPEPTVVENAEELKKKKNERAKKNAYQSRWRRKSTLVKAVAEFQNLLQLRSRVMDRDLMAEISVQLYKIGNLHKGWSEQDMARSWGALKALQKKYLGNVPAKFNKDEAEALVVMLNTMEESKLTNLQKANVAVELLTSVGRDLLISAGDGLTPSPDAALMLLTQDTNGTLPKWFANSLAELLEQHLTRGEIRRFLLELSNVIQERDEKKYGESDAKARQAAAQQEAEAEMDAIDAGGFLSQAGVAMK